MNKFIKVTKIILNTLMTIIIVFGCIFAFMFVIGITPYVVKSGSMEPAVHVGSVCFVDKNAKYEDMKVNDIIAFQPSNDMFATHRIVEITDEGFKTKGDANEEPDNSLVKKDTFIGKNIFSIPNAGFLVASLQTTRGKIILGTIILVIFLAGILIGEPAKNEQTKKDPKEILKKHLAKFKKNIRR